MTYAPQDLIDVLSYMNSKGAPWASLGCVAGPADAQSGGYHCGHDLLHAIGVAPEDPGWDYSYGESLRDRNGLTDAASAIDFAGASWWRSFTLWLVDQCSRGVAGTGDVREIIYTPDGNIVRRWDRLGIRSSGDSSHLYHTHVSFFRDSEGRRGSFLGLVKSYFGDVPQATTAYADEEEDMDTGEVKFGTKRTMIGADDANAGLAKNGPCWLSFVIDPAFLVEKGVTSIQLRVALTDGLGWSVKTVTLGDKQNGRPGWRQSVPTFDGYCGARVDRLGLVATPDPNWSGDPANVPTSKDFDPVGQIEIGWCEMYGPKRA